MGKETGYDVGSKEITPEEAEAIKRNEAMAGVVVAIFVVAIIGLVVWAVIQTVPLVVTWVAERGEDEVACVFDPEDTTYDAEAVFSFCTAKGFEPTDDAENDGMDITEEVCASVGFILAGDSLVESCDAYCKTAWTPPDTCTYRPPEGTDPTILNDYLVKTDDLIDDMGRYLGKIEVLITMYYESGNNNSARATILNDKQYKEIVEGVHYDARLLYRKLEELWPPPPYDSSNPLLDSQARLTTAVALVMRVDGLIYRFHVNLSSQQWNEINDSLVLIQKNMDYAELGLALAR